VAIGRKLCDERSDSGRGIVRLVALGGSSFIGADGVARFIRHRMSGFLRCGGSSSGRMKPRSSAPHRHGQERGTHPRALLRRARIPPSLERINLDFEALERTGNLIGDFAVMLDGKGLIFGFQRIELCLLLLR